MALVAGADLGSNNFRLLVAEELSQDVFREVALENRIVRAGEGIGAGGRVLPEAEKRVRACLAAFAETLESLGVGRRVASLTAAGRDLEGGGLYAEIARETLGAEVLVPSGEEEARLAFSGAMGVLGLYSGDRMMLDIGGGSTEIAWTSEDGEINSVSLKIGVVRLAEELKLTYPTGEEGLSALKSRAARAFSGDASLAALKGWKGRFGPGGARLVATAGTALTLAARFSSRPIENTRALSAVGITAKEVDAFASELARLNLGGIRSLPEVAPGREDVILAGVAILSSFLEQVGAPGCVVSDGGLAEGLVLGFATGGAGIILPENKVGV